MKTFIVCIDGPAGSGKSTVSRLLAKTLGFTYLDTGAIYRSVALAAKDTGIDWQDGPALGELATGLEIAFENTDDGSSIFVNGKDVSREIRTPEISRGSSIVSAHPEVRAALLDLQRRIGNSTNCVAEGRDVGTVIFPDAQAKIYLDASLEERAQRRSAEFNSSGQQLSLEEVMNLISERDKNDSQRKTAPLRQAEDAIEINTSDLTIEQVIAGLRAIVEERLEKA